MFAGRVIEDVEGNAKGRLHQMRQIDAIDEDGDVNDRRLRDKIEADVAVGADDIASTEAIDADLRRQRGNNEIDHRRAAAPAGRRGDSQCLPAGFEGQRVDGVAAIGIGRQDRSADLRADGGDGFLRRDRDREADRFANALPVFQADHADLWRQRGDREGEGLGRGDAAFVGHGDGDAVLARREEDRVDGESAALAQLSRARAKIDRDFGGWRLAASLDGDRLRRIQRAERGQIRRERDLGRQRGNGKLNDAAAGVAVGIGGRRGEIVAAGQVSDRVDRKDEGGFRLRRRLLAVDGEGHAGDRVVGQHRRGHVGRLAQRIGQFGQADNRHRDRRAQDGGRVGAALRRQHLQSKVVLRAVERQRHVERDDVLAAQLRGEVGVNPRQLVGRGRFVCAGVGAAG